MAVHDPLMQWRRVMHAERFRATGTDFERYVSEVLRNFHPDFVNPQPTGRLGDGGSDGIAEAGRVLYACFGTARVNDLERVLASKIRSDFDRALVSYPDFTSWRFITNAPVGPKAVAMLVEIQREHGADSPRPLNVVSWGVDRFWEDVISALPESRLAAVFGPSPTAPALVPRQLQARGHAFVNRRRELGALDGAVERARAEGRPAVAILHGGHGAGKTAIGEHWSRQNETRFTSGQILVDYGELRRAGGASPGDVLGAVLRDLGYSPEEIPESLERRTAFYRSVTAGAHRDLLVILDDVDTSAQVRPLIPNSPAAAVIVTTRARLEDLFVDGSVEAVEIERLEPDKANHLIQSLLGPVRTAAEQPAVEALLAYCDGLPLAIAIVAARLRADSGRQVGDAVAALEAESTRLHRLGVRDGISLEAIWDDSYRQLSPNEAEAYRRLGQHPALSYTLESAMAAIGTDRGTAVALLDALRSRHLLEATSGQSRRYRYHDLLRLHARRTGDEVDGPQGRAQVTSRVAEYYVALCGTLDRAVTATRLRLAIIPMLAEGPRVPAEARARFQDERSSILRLLDTATALGLNRPVWSIAESLWPLYTGQGHAAEAARVFEIGAEAAAADGRDDGAARLWGLVARMRLELGDIDGARAALGCAWEKFGSGGDIRIEGMLCEVSGIVHSDAGDPVSALEMFRRARLLCAEQGSRRGVAIQDYLIGKAHADLGEWELALAALSSASDEVEELDDRVLLARVLFHLARALEGNGRDVDAAAAYERGIELARFAGNPGYEARANEALGELARRRGDPLAARRFFVRGADLLRLLDAGRAADLERRARLIEG